jgi:hypothetical protein
MSVCPDTTETECGCCTGILQEVPELIVNAPALPAISYRAGRYATFNASMLASLSQSAYEPLSLLRTRDPGDFTIALLDSWAVVLDILTFYQERFANEAFLRTAVDRRSVFELSRLIGYVPSPGVAATGTLTFTLSDAPGSPDNVLIPAGTRVQSVPGPGQKPQVFETSADITAKISYNALPVRTNIPWRLASGDTSTWIQGTAGNVNIGDMLLFVSATDGSPSPTGPADCHPVTAVSLDSNNGMTRISWDAPLSSTVFSGTTLTATQVCLYVFRKKAALYGVQAPDPATLPGGAVGSGIKGAPATAGNDWAYANYVSGSGQLNLDALYTGLAPAGNVPSFALLTGSNASAAFFRVTAADESNPRSYALSLKSTRLGLDWGQMLSDTSVTSLDTALSGFESDTRNVAVYVQSVQLPLASPPLLQWSGNPGGLMLQSGMLAPVGGNHVEVVGGQQIARGQPIGIRGKRVRLSVATGAGASFTPAGSSGSLEVADNQVFLLDTFPPTTEQTSGGTLTAWSVLTLSGIAGELAVDPTNVVLMPADKDDPATSEAAHVTTMSVDGDITTINLGGALGRLYDSRTTTVNANAVEASNGETVQELLGSGDATHPALTFTLKQAPLTYISSTGTNGTQSTLQVWVNNLRWREVPNLLSAGPADRVFVTRTNPSGYTVVQFGDGIHGSRTPTGQMNIRAVYRKGIGSAGMVAAGQLSQPLDRPQGLRAAINPSAASGGADPATADAARASAPLPTMTIGRVVSLEDYADYALNFGGIAKASASWTFFGGARGVFLTVAGAGGATFEPSDEVVVNLLSSLRLYGSRYVPLRVASYVPVLFQVGANVRIDDTTYDPTLVLDQVWRNLAAAFAFDRRRLGQPVVAGEIIAIIQQTPGVIALQLTTLAPSGAPGGVQNQLCAAGPLPPQGAQLLLLDPGCRNAIGAGS